MAVSAKTKTVRSAAKQAVEKGRENIQAAENRAKDARESGFYSEEGTRNYVGGWVKDARKNAIPALESAEKKAREARKAAEQILHNVRSVPAAERNTSAAILLPVIQAGASNPEVLVNAYRIRAPNSLANRFVLEDAIQACIDAGLGGVGFVEAWGQSRAELADSVESDDEREATEDLAALDALDSYLSAARTVAETDLETVESGGSPRYGAALEWARHTVSRYEKETGGAGVKKAAGGRTEQDEADAEIIRRWCQQQEAKRVESEASGDKGGEAGEGSE